MIINLREQAVTQAYRWLAKQQAHGVAGDPVDSYMVLFRLVTEITQSQFSDSFSLLVLEAASIIIDRSDLLPLFSNSLRASHFPTTGISSQTMKSLPFPAHTRAAYPSLFCPFRILNNEEDENGQVAFDRPSSSGPDALNRTFAAHLSHISHRKGPPSHDVRAFHREREHRRRTLRRAIAPGGRLCRAQWGAPITGDFAIGSLKAKDGVRPSDELRTRDLSEVKWVSLTTFPVDGPLMEQKGEAEDGTPYWASTAQKKAVMQELLYPTAAASELWLDSNPSPRPGGIGTDPKDLATIFAFALTLRLLRTLDVPLIAIYQKGNLELLLPFICPSHTSDAIGPLSHSPNLFTSHTAEELDEFWFWAEEGGPPAPEGFHQTTPTERTLFLYHNVLDVQDKLPHHPRAVFFRRFRGGRNLLALFASHPCNLDPFVYTADQFGIAGESIERSGLTVESIFTGQVVQRQDPPILRTHFLSPSLNLHYLHSVKQKGYLPTLVHMRRDEIVRKEPIPLDSMSNSLLSLISTRLTRCPDPRALDEYTPNPAAKSPPSVLADLLSLLSSLTLTGLAKREKEANLPPDDPNYLHLGSFQRHVLEDARSSEVWRAKLEKIGVGALSFVMGTQFSAGVALKEKHLTPILQDTSKRLSLSSASPDASLWFSAHLTLSTMPSAAGRGALAKVSRVHRVQLAWRTGLGGSTGKWYPTDTACEACTRVGARACALPYGDAVRDGVPQRIVGAEEVMDHLRGWLKVLEEERAEQERQRSGRSGDWAVARRTQERWPSEEVDRLVEEVSDTLSAAEARYGGFL